MNEIKMPRVRSKRVVKFYYKEKKKRILEEIFKKKYENAFSLRI